MSRLPRELAEAFRAEWRLKLSLLVLLSLAFCIPYFLLQSAPIAPLRAVPETPIDRWIPFDPRWTWAYQSIYGLIGLPALFAARRSDLLRFANGFLRLSIAGFVVFLFLPTAAPQPVDIPDYAAYRLLRSYDGAVNAMPSLHAALGMHAIRFGRVLLGRRSPSEARWWSVVAGAWLGVILLATLFTKQHWFLDLPAGLAIGWLAFRRAWRDPRPAPAPITDSCGDPA